MPWYALIYHTIIRGKQISLVSARIFRYGTTKSLSRKRRHRTIFCISFLWPKKYYITQKKTSSGILHQSNRNWLLWICPKRKKYQNPIELQLGTYRKCLHKAHFSTQWVGGVKHLSTDRHKTLLSNGTVKNPWNIADVFYYWSPSRCQVQNT